MAQREGDLDRDVHADVSYAELGPDYERKVGEPITGVRGRPAGPPELAEGDLLIERKDLGPASSTLITAGSPIPPDLAGLPAGQSGPHASGRPWAGGTATSGVGLSTASSSPSNNSSPTRPARPRPASRLRSRRPYA